MLHRKATAIILIVLAVTGGALLTRVKSVPPIAKTVPVVARAEPTGSRPSEETARPAEFPLASEETPAASRSEESRAADKRDFVNPLVPSDPPVTPPYRHAANAGSDVAAEFDRINLMLRDFRSMTGGNPVGTNAEIMKSIMGDNPKGARLGPPDGQSLNSGGELIDRWGTPYFFHQLTRDVMEIHSAGPDRRMWNEDDIVSD